MGSLALRLWAMLRSIMTRMKTIGLGTLLWLALQPALVVAAPAAASKKLQGSRDWKEVERGLYATGQVGLGLAVVAPKQGPFMSGLSLGLSLGYDLGERLELEATMIGVQMNAPVSYRGVGNSSIPPGGQFITLLAGIRARYGYLSIADGQGIRRLFLTLSLGGGILNSAPASQLGGLHPELSVGTGLRYYTRMRHFSISFELEANYGLGAEFLLIHPQLGLAYSF